MVTENNNIEDIKNKIYKIIRKNFINTEFQYNDNLFELGLDSIKCIELIIDIETIFDFEYKSEDLLVKNFENINLIAEYIQHKV